MSPRRYTLAALLLGSLALGACSKDKDVEPPAELVDFDAKIGVQTVWSTSLGGGEEVMRLGLAPAAEGDRVYAAGRNGDVVALQATTGRALWRARTRAELSGGPGVGFGLVVVGSTNGEVVALDAASGAARWTVNVGSEVLSAPAVASDAVIVRTVAGALHGLSPTDGRLLWREDQQIPRLTLRGAATPAVSGTTAVCGFDNGRVLAVETGSGEVLWEQLVSPARGRTELERIVDIDSAVKVSEQDVFVAGYQGRVALLALDSGQAWWSRELSSHRGLDVDAERVYVSTAAGEIVALRRRSGIDLWRQAGLRMRRLSAPAVVGNFVAVADFEGIVHWLDASSGEFVARSRAGDRISNAPVVVGDLVVFQDDDGRVTALRPRG